MSRDRILEAHPREAGEFGGNALSTTSVAGPRWYACYTMARREKKVHARFGERGLESFLPIVPRTSQWHDRRKRIEWPLLPGYVFARFRLPELYHVLGTPGVSSVVRMNGLPAPISDEEIRNIARFATALAESKIEPRQVRFREGQRVRIVSGPFEGIEGIVLELRGRRRVLVGLRTIGLGFEVDVSDQALRPLD